MVHGMLNSKAALFTPIFPAVTAAKARFMVLSLNWQSFLGQLFIGNDEVHLEW